MKYKAIIFDLDGVICHTDEYHYEAWKKLADSLGVYFDKRINNRLRGVSRMQSLEIVLENYDGELDDERKVGLADEKNETYKKLLEKMTNADISPVVVSTLETIRKHGIKTAIGSSSKNAGLILEKTAMTGYFDAVADGNVITRSKPDPEVFLRAAEYLGLPPSDCLVVEDAFAGIDAGLAGGFDCVGMGDAAAYERASYRISSFDELLKIVL